MTTRLLTPGGVPGTVLFDTFAGVDDNAKIKAMNAWAAGNPNAVVLFSARQYNFNTPIMLYSGLKLQGTAGFPIREYNRGTVFNWQGGAGSSMLAYPAKQTGQTYPSDNSPRDITMEGIQFQGGSSTHFLPKLSPGQYQGTTLWYCNFHNCGWKNFGTVWWGAGTGTSFGTGVSHFQGIADTAFYVGGSENTFFGSDRICFADSQVVSNTPFFRSAMQKSRIGLIMITARKGNYCISVENGRNLLIDAVSFDSQSSDPIYGPGLVIRGGEAITVRGCSFKGVATQGARAWIEVTGGGQITFEGNNFNREGNNVPAPDFPLLWVEADAGLVRWGYNNYANFGGVRPVVHQEKAGLISLIDSSVTRT